MSVDLHEPRHFIDGLLVDWDLKHDAGQPMSHVFDAVNQVQSIAG